VRQCAAAIGPDRRFYSTADTVADLEALRAALGVPKLTLDGVSYGTFVAERYALAHPDRVGRLVLDSVLVHSGYNVFDLVPLHATARVLRTLCAEQHCRTDPVADLAAVVRRYHDGAQILDTLTAYSVGAPSFPGWLEALHAARGGHPRALRRKLAAVRLGQRAPATVLSQGLHASTLCADDPVPWGGPNAPLASRGPALARALARLTPAATYPYDRATMVGNGALQTCRQWPPMATASAPRPRELPPVPVLLLAGDHDLSTPLEWARREAAVAPQGKLVVIHGAGHGPSLRAKSNRARVALARFLQG
jgi:pimeloyl-ACP methyl ester carboxylesterase